MRRAEAAAAEGVSLAPLGESWADLAAIRTRLMKNLKIQLF